MTLLLCPECCQWREPVEGRCPVCSGTLDLALPDPSLETLAEEMGDLQDLLGEAELSRKELPNRGRLFGTTNGLLFMPNESRVILFAAPQDFPLTPISSPRRGEGNRGGLRRFVSRLWSCLMRRDPTTRFACERPRELISHDRLKLAELLRSDPGVLFWSRGEIAQWRRQAGKWEFVRSDARSWPERVAMHDRDGERALQTWLETTECPTSANVR